LPFPCKPPALPVDSVTHQPSSAPSPPAEPVALMSTRGRVEVVREAGSPGCRPRLPGRRSRGRFCDDDLLSLCDPGRRGGQPGLPGGM